LKKLADKKLTHRTLEECARRLGISRMRAQQLEMAALRKLAKSRALRDMALEMGIDVGQAVDRGPPRRPKKEAGAKAAGKSPEARARHSAFMRAWHARRRAEREAAKAV
jgi:hypothetical protein